MGGLRLLLYSVAILATLLIVVTAIVTLYLTRKSDRESDQTLREIESMLDPEYRNMDIDELLGLKPSGTRRRGSG